MSFTTSPKCSKSIGCKVHRGWDQSFVRNTFYQSTGFTRIDLSFCSKMFSSNNSQNKEAEQRLCQLANHQGLNSVMKQKKYPAKTLVELTPEHEKDLKDTEHKGSTCLGLNYGMGTDKIAV